MGKIIQGDCLEVMKEIEDKSIDLVLTDPPYNISRKNNQTNKQNIPLCPSCIYIRIGFNIRSSNNL